jgi:hypothetical protein
MNASGRLIPSSSVTCSHAVRARAPSRTDPGSDEGLVPVVCTGVTAEWDFSLGSLESSLCSGGCIVTWTSARCTDKGGVEVATESLVLQSVGKSTMRLHGYP